MSVRRKIQSLWTEHAVRTSVATQKLTFSKSMPTGMYGGHSQLYFGAGKNLRFVRVLGLPQDLSHKSQLYLPPNMLYWSTDKAFA